MQTFQSMVRINRALPQLGCDAKKFQHNRNYVNNLVQVRTRRTLPPSPDAVTLPTLNMHITYKLIPIHFPAQYATTNTFCLFYAELSK